MGSVYRRGYKDRNTGVVKRTRTYTIKFRGSEGRWVTESTNTTSKVIALRLLAEREMGSAESPGISGVRDLEVEGDGPILEELRERYLESISLRLRESTCRMYAERLGFTLRQLDSGSLDEVDTPRIDAYVRKRLAGGATPRTVNLQVAVLQRMLVWAKEHELINHNPLERWKPIRDPGTHRRRALNPDELRGLLDVAPSWRRILWMTMAATGMRKGEAVRLLVSDFDPTTGAIYLRPEITKACRGRVCPLPTGLTQLLEEHLERQKRNAPRRQREYLAMIRRCLAEQEQAGQGDHPRAISLRRMEAAAVASLGHRQLFTNGNGMPIRLNLDREFRADLKRAGIKGPGVSIHSLRYTANTSLLTAGIPETVVRARMGHVTSKMTERYFDPLADNGAGTGAVASLLGVEDGNAETPPEPTRAEPGGGLTLADDTPFRPTSEMLAALTERYSNIAIGKILEVSEAAVRMMLKRAGIKRANRIETRLDDWQAVIIRAELKAEMARKDEPNGRVVAG